MKKCFTCHAPDYEEFRRAAFFPITIKTRRTAKVFGDINSSMEFWGAYTEGDLTSSFIVRLVRSLAP